MDNADTLTCILQKTSVQKCARTLQVGYNYRVGGSAAIGMTTTTIQYHIIQPFPTALVKIRI